MLYRNWVLPPSWTRHLSRRTWYGDYLILAYGHCDLVSYGVSGRNDSPVSHQRSNLPVSMSIFGRRTRLRGWVDDLVSIELGFEFAN